MINVVCVLKSQPINNHGIHYSKPWVDRLYKGVKQNLDIPFEFTCLTNEVVNCKSIPLITDSNGYWNKIELFRKNLFQGPVLYLDLDVVICKNITDDISNLPKNKFLMVKEPYKDIHNSSMMFWDQDYSYLFDEYLRNQSEIVNEYQFNLARNGCLGDQAYIGENVNHELIDDYVCPGFINWRHHKISTNIANPSILIFTGSQKPSNNLELDLVNQHWAKNVS
jgi:hypothetical protein